MKLPRLFVAAMILAIGMAGSASAFSNIYFNEANYLADLAVYAGSQVFESFEGADWDVARYPTTVPSLTSQGLTWTAGDGVSTVDGWARSGDYGIFDNFGDPDALMSATATTTPLVGIGGWFRTSSAENIGILLDEEFLGVWDIGASAPHTFFGLIHSDGFSGMSFLSDGHYGADDFTVGLNPVPEPATLFLFGSGLIAARAFAGRKRSKK